jgi:peptide deformylase
MTPLSIRRFPDSILKQATQPVARLEKEALRLIERMIATMRAHPRCVGLAAPQVGSSWRIAVMDATGHPKVPSSQGLIVLVNPQIFSQEGDVVQREGCLSIPDLTANVQRSTQVRVKAFDQFGVWREVRLEGFEAIIAQHEIDHLDGKLFLDRVANLATDVFRRKTYL